jgi:dissimilatory sulfite reductase beta subunit
MSQVETTTKPAPAKAPTPRRAVESGVPDNTPFLHPLMLKNYGKWKYHDRPRPGVLHHVAQSGDELWTVKAGTQRQMDVWTIRKLCDIIDKFGEGRVRFTIRSNVEIGVSTWEKVGPLIEALESAGFPVGGTGNSISMIAHTQGWLHCDIPGTDASGVVKALMDELIDEFKRKCEMPNRVHLSTSCCEINCGGQADIAIIVQHTKPPKINHDLVANVCERPAVVAAARWRRSARRWSTASRRWKSTRRSASAAAPATRHARRCRSTTPSTPSSRSGSAARTPTPRQADLP